MDAEHGGMPDLENGGGVVDSNLTAAGGTPPYPADPEIKEKQPFTCLGAVPYVVAGVVGAAILVAGVVLVFSAELGESYDLAKDSVGVLLVCVGTVVLALGLFLGYIVCD